MLAGSQANNDACYKEEPSGPERPSSSPSLRVLCSFSMLSVLVAGFLFLSVHRHTSVLARQPSGLQLQVLPHAFDTENVTHSLNVSNCPGESTACEHGLLGAHGADALLQDTP